MERDETSDVDHLTRGLPHILSLEPQLTLLIFGKKPAMKRPAVNVGSQLHPVWFAQEHLRIVPYQLFTRPVPEKYTSCMVREACRSPNLTRAYLEHEGLASLGFTPSKEEAAFVSFNIHEFVSC